MGEVLRSACMGVYLSVCPLAYLKNGMTNSTFYFCKQRRTIGRDSSFVMQKISTKLRKMSVEQIKIAFFDRSRSVRLIRLTAENLCPSATVVRVHYGSLAEEYAASSTTLAIVECDDHSYGPVDINKVRSTEVC